MKLKGITKPLFALLAVALLSHCSLLEQAVKKPTVKFSGLRFDKLSQDSLDLAALLSINNPNSYGIAVDKIHYKLLVNEKALLDNQSQELNGLPANGSEQVALPLSLSGETLKGFKSLISEEQLNYTVEGAIEILGLSLPFSKTGTWYRPSFEVADVDVKKASLSEVALNVGVAIENKNQGELPISDIRYSIASQGSVLSAGKIADTTLKQGRNELNIPVMFSPKSLAGNVLKLLKSPVLPVTITLETPVKTIKHEYRVNLSNVYQF